MKPLPMWLIMQLYIYCCFPNCLYTIISSSVWTTLKYTPCISFIELYFISKQPQLMDVKCMSFLWWWLQPNTPTIMSKPKLSYWETNHLISNFWLHHLNQVYSKDLLKTLCLPKGGSNLFMKLKGKYNAHTIHIFNKYRINIHIYTLISL